MQKKFWVDHERGRNHGSVTKHGTLLTKGKKSVKTFSAQDQKGSRDNLRAKYTATDGDVKRSIKADKRKWT